MEMSPEPQRMEFKKGVCCLKYAEIMIGLNMGMRVPMVNVIGPLRAAEEAGLDPQTGFFIAVAVGHRIQDHGDDLKAAQEFAGLSGLPDVPVKTHFATADDILKDCDINREVAAAIMEGKSKLPEDVAPEIRERAKKANLPADFTDAQVIVALHAMESHNDTLEAAIEFCVGDSEFAQAVRATRLN